MRKNKNSLIVKIYGIFKFVTSNEEIIVTVSRNLKGGIKDSQILKIYDLKGSS